ncbi:hypothetical protein INR49_011024, partial [Caranx melampygus]
MSAVLRIESVTLRKPGVALPVAPLIRNQREGIWSDQRYQLLLPLCTHTTSWSSSLVSGEGLIRMYDSLFPWSVIPSDTGRKERLNRVSLCWLIRSAALPGPPLAPLELRPPFLLSRRAHCMLFLLSSGWSEEWEEVEMGSEEVELRCAP